MWRLTAILYTLPLFTCAQPVTKVVKQHKGFREEYYVLKADNRTRQGAYFQITDRDKVLREGSYNRGTQVGKWKTYYPNGRLFTQGSYSDGYEAGVWEYYAPKGRLIQKYDYALQKLVYYYRDRHEDTRLYKVVTDKGIISATLSRPPLYIGGIYVLQTLVKQNLADAYEIHDINGTVVVSVLIGSNGTASMHRVISSTNALLTEPILNTMKTLPSFWLPGRRHNIPVDAYMEIEFSDMD